MFNADEVTIEEDTAVGDAMTTEEADMVVVVPVTTIAAGKVTAEVAREDMKTATGEVVSIASTVTVVVEREEVLLEVLLIATIRDRAIVEKDMVDAAVEREGVNPMARARKA